MARKLARHGIAFTKQDNAFLGIKDFPRAQRLADRFVSLDWTARLDRYARLVNPLLEDLLPPFTYYWVTAQAEYSTDLLFKTRRQLEEFVPRLIEHATLHFSARDVMTFLGRKYNGNFQGEAITDQVDTFPKVRLPG